MMLEYPPYIVSEFAEIFEDSIISDSEIDMASYCHYRDDFYQLIRSNLANRVETSEEIENRFRRAPSVNSLPILSFAAGNAEYYSRILNINPPEWCFDVPSLPDSSTPCFPFPRIIQDLNETIENTPEELYRRGFIYDEHNFDVY